MDFWEIRSRQKLGRLYIWATTLLWFISVSENIGPKSFYWDRQTAEISDTSIRVPQNEYFRLNSNFFYNWLDNAFYNFRRGIELSLKALRKQDSSFCDMVVGHINTVGVPDAARGPYVWHGWCRFKFTISTALWCYILDFVEITLLRRNSIFCHQMSHP